MERGIGCIGERRRDILEWRDKEKHDVEERG